MAQDKSRNDQKSAGAADDLWVSRGVLLLYILLVLAGVMLGAFVHRLVTPHLSWALRAYETDAYTADLVVPFSILLGLVPVVAAQVTIIGKGGRQQLAKRWLKFVSAAWIVGAFTGYFTGQLSWPFLGPLSGGLACVILLVHAHVSGRSKARTAGRTP